MAKSEDLKNWTERSWTKLDYECGLGITAKEYEKLKQILRDDWTDCTAHQILTGYYLANLHYTSGVQLEVVQKEYTNHLLWLIEHYPQIEDLQHCQTVFITDIQKIQDSWNRALLKNPDSSEVRRNAEVFFRMISD